MKKAIGIAALVAMALSSCGGDSVVIDTLKTDTGECFVIMNHNRSAAGDYDRTYSIPCEITTAENVSADK